MWKVQHGNFELGLLRHSVYGLLPQGNSKLGAIGGLVPSCGSPDSPFLNGASEDLQGGGVFSVVVGLYDDVHVLIEGDEETQKALHGELAEVAAQHLRDIGLADAEEGSGLDLFQAALFHDRIDLEDQLCLDQVLFGVGQAEVFKYVAAAEFVILLAHIVPLAICSAWRSRSWINSMSRRGVSRPVFDFF